MSTELPRTAYHSPQCPALDDFDNEDACTCREQSTGEQRAYRRRIAAFGLPALLAPYQSARFVGQVRR